MFSLKYEDGTPVPPPHRFSIRHFPIDNGPERWPYRRVEIFDGETRIGEYIRKYPHYTESTFYPFEWAGRWFALYSADYTCTRLMSLPDCKDIGGEEPDAGGFCPTEFYVPACIEQTFKFSDGGDKPTGSKVVVHTYWDSRPIQSVFKGSTAWEPGWSETVGRWTYAPFGFVSGCIWGDDYRWKLEYIDLTEANHGKLQRKELFGRVELPRGLTLRDCVDMLSWRPDNPRIEYVSSRIINLETGNHESDLD